MSVKIAICDDSTAFRESLAQFIDDTPGFSVIISASSADELVAFMEVNKPEIILMDIDMPQMTGTQATALIKQQYPSVHILMLTVYEDEEKIFDSVMAGASGYLLKKTPPEKIIQAFSEIADGGASMSPLIVRKVLDHFNEMHPSKKEYNLSPQEMKVLQCLVKGHSYKMIAADCHISLSTVRFHINNIYKKLHINSKSEAVAKALKEKLT